jgi:Zn-dependent M28 family amino/carboxypeptidase
VYLGVKNSFLIDSRGFEDKERAELIRYAFNFTSTAPTFVTTDQKFTWSVGRNHLKHPLIQIQDSIIEIGQKFEVNIEATLINDFEANNVIGYLPGKKKCAKTIVFCAHYDHLGGLGKNTYIPGANDNASGTAMLITLANYFKKNPSDYNMLFIAFSGEEAGLLGSEYFVSNSPLKLKKIRFVLNLDIMGSGEEGITVVNATEYVKEFELLQRINTEQQLLPKVKSRGETSNSDHYHFHQNGVPSFFIYTMGTNKHYHDVFDTYDALTFEAYNNVMKLLQTFVEQL